MLLYLSLIDNEEDKIKLEDIYNSYKKTMYYVANKILEDEHYSHDAVQISFLKIIKNIDKIEEINCNKTKRFIVTIVKNTAIDIYRKNKREKEKVKILEHERTEVEDGFNNIKELSSNIEIAILKLPERYKSVFFLKYCHGVHDNKIGDILGISASTVRTRIKRGKEKLKSILEEMEI